MDRKEDSSNVDYDVKKWENVRPSDSSKVELMKEKMSFMGEDSHCSSVVVENLKKTVKHNSERTKSYEIETTKYEPRNTILPLTNSSWTVKALAKINTYQIFILNTRFKVYSKEHRGIFIEVELLEIDFHEWMDYRRWFWHTEMVILKKSSGRSFTRGMKLKSDHEVYLK